MTVAVGGADDVRWRPTDREVWDPSAGDLFRRAMSDESESTVERLDERFA